MPPRRLILTIFAVGVIGLSIALFAPSLIDPIINDVSTTASMSEGETIALTETLNMTLDGVDQGADTVNATFTSTRTRNITTTGLVDVGNTTTVQLDGDSIEFTAEAITGTMTADVTAVYTPVFGWDGGARTFFENLDIIMMIVFAALAISLSLLVVKEI